MPNKTDPKIELPRINHKKSGMKQAGDTYHVLYYEDGKLRSISTKETTLKKAAAKRDRFHKNKVERGATYKGSRSNTVEAAFADPEGMAGIYAVKQYRVVIEGVTVCSVTDKQVAIDRRNQYIEENHNTK